MNHTILHIVSHGVGSTPLFFWLLTWVFVCNIFNFAFLLIDRFTNKSTCNCFKNSNNSRYYWDKRRERHRFKVVGENRDGYSQLLFWLLMWVFVWYVYTSFFIDCFTKQLTYDWFINSNNMYCWNERKR